jgi:hypothetical protein
MGAKTPLGGRIVAVEELIPIIDRPATNYHVRQAAAPPVIDGEPGEWEDVPAMVLNSGGVWRKAPWTIPDDASADLRLLWDPVALYFCLRIRDDVYCADNAAKDFWMNDCIQFVFDAYMNGPGGYDSDEYSLTLCDSPQGPLMASYYWK